MNDKDREPKNPLKKTRVEGQMRNPSVVAALKFRENESWNNTFGSKSKEEPKLQNRITLRPKYHVEGICYKDCTFHKSHKKRKVEDFAKKD